MTEQHDFDEDEDVSIGRGTWIDKLALDVISRKDNLTGDHPALIRTESGLGASGFPHIGSFADASRAYAFKLAVEDLGRESEFIAFADDMDGLRKVPAGTPSELKKHLGKPVSNIPDPWGCHNSYGKHMSSLLIDTIKDAGIEFTAVSAFELYTSGKLTEHVDRLLTMADLAGQIIKETTGQEKYLEVLPFHAICENCGKIYTTRSVSYDKKQGLVEYYCEGDEIGGKLLGGCNHHGYAKIARGEGKLTWKVEFAARWDYLQIDFEAFGKDIYESVICNDRISKEVFDYEPPTHARYEVFLDKDGRKISKSKGNVVTPQTWFRYGSPQSLALLTYKRMTGSRRMDIDQVPSYMQELDYLEDIYFGKIKEGNPAKKRKLSGLYEYCWHLKPPSVNSNHVPYKLLVNLLSVAPEVNRTEFLELQLKEYGYIRDEHSVKEIQERIIYAENWVHDFQHLEDVKVELSKDQQTALASLITRMEESESADDIQTAIFQTATEHAIKPREFFRILYQILLNDDRGPKLGPYIHTIGVKNTIKMLGRYL